MIIQIKKVIKLIKKYQKEILLTKLELMILISCKKKILKKSSHDVVITVLILAEKGGNDVENAICAPRVNLFIS